MSASPKIPATRQVFEFDSDNSDAADHAIESDSEPDYPGLHNQGDSAKIDVARHMGDISPAPPEEGMLLRDRPRKTTFHDAVAERQMTQADAKLFFQRSQLDQSQATPHGSPPASVGVPAVKLPNDASFAHAHSNLTAHPSSISLSPVAQSYDFPHIAGSSTNMPNPGTAPRTATRPSLGEYIGSRQASYMRRDISQERSKTNLQPDMGLPDGATSNIASGFGSNDPLIAAELGTIFQNIQKILDIRHKYIRLSLQRDGDNPKDDPSWDIYPPPPEPAWAGSNKNQDSQGMNTGSNSMSNSTVLPGQAGTHRIGHGNTTTEFEHKRTAKKRKPGHDIGEDFDMADLLPLPQESEFAFRLDENGVYQVFENEAADKANTPVVGVPTIKDFYLDLEQILSTSSDGPSKSFAFRRLQYLEGKFNLYTLLNEYQETADTKRVPHRDFYNVRKVDTHVHHSACMNQKHLLRFIKSKMKKSQHEYVLFRDGKNLTLDEVFKSINLTAYDLSIDTLDMHVSE